VLHSFAHGHPLAQKKIQLDYALNISRAFRHRVKKSRVAQGQKRPAASRAGGRKKDADFRLRRSADCIARQRLIRSQNAIANKKTEPDRQKQGGPVFGKKPAVSDTAQTVVDKSYEGGHHKTVETGSGKKHDKHKNRIYRKSQHG
jgi:hypothetical protein